MYYNITIFECTLVTYIEVMEWERSYRSTYEHFGNNDKRSFYAWLKNFWYPWIGGWGSSEAYVVVNKENLFSTINNRNVVFQHLNSSLIDWALLFHQMNLIRSILLAKIWRQNCVLSEDGCVLYLEAFVLYSKSHKSRQRYLSERRSILLHHQL